MSKLRRITVTMLLGLLVLAGTGYVIYFFEPPKEEARAGRFRPNPNRPVPVLAAQVRVADVPVYIDGVGTTKALNTVTVRPQVEGKLIEIAFREGQDVNKGDVLARIDPTTYKAQHDQVLAKKAQDEAQLANARRDLERYARLAASNAATQQQADTQRALVAQLEALVRLDQASVDNARAVLGYTTITAPISGRTGIRLVDEGNVVRAADTSGIVVITEIKPIWQAHGRRQPGRSDHRHGAAQGRVSQCQPAALARPVRQCPAADQYAPQRRRGTDRGGTARPERDLRLRGAAAGHRGRRAGDGHEAR
jgi:multidrug efflux system membrane fusion protein